MLSDIEISRRKKPENIYDIAKKLGVGPEFVIPYGPSAAKITQNPKKQKGKLVLVTAINPTKAGNGKTTVAIGLADAFTLAGERAALALREPSLGPVFGTKGGATGGGYSQIVPMEDINLHFTGDFHSITSANNLLCALVDNHIFQGNLLNVDENNIFVRRCVDLNERALRDVALTNPIRNERFIITAASEVMAILCMASDLTDLKVRLGNILVALDKLGNPLYARDFKAENAMAILLKNAIYPNLVQTLGGTPAIVHCGPFANIAHGCNSVRATKLALSCADFVITEAGFGADLGAEKFFDYKCRVAGLKPDAVVLIATIRALKLHGGEKEENLNQENLTALERGLPNLIHHINTIKNVFGLPVVVTLNKYSTDTKKEIELLKKLVSEPVIENDVWAKGGKGASELMMAIKESIGQKNEFRYAYDLNESVEDKIISIVKKVYGGSGIVLSSRAKEKIRIIEKLGFSNLPVIMAKTQCSLTADKTRLGAPKDFVVAVNDLEIRSGAGFIVAVCGEMLLMPALGKNPAAINMTIDGSGKIEGLF